MNYWQLSFWVQFEQLSRADLVLQQQLSIAVPNDMLIIVRVQASQLLPAIVSVLQQAEGRRLETSSVTSGYSGWWTIKWFICNRIMTVHNRNEDYLGNYILSWIYFKIFRYYDSGKKYGKLFCWSHLLFLSEVVRGSGLELYISPKNIIIENILLLGWLLLLLIPLSTYQNYNTSV